MTLRPRDRDDLPLVLVLDDNPASLAEVRADLRGVFTVVEARDIERALAVFGAIAGIRAAVAHVNLSRGPGGVSFMVEAAWRAPRCVRILVSESTRLGESWVDFAHAFVQRPWKPGGLATVLRRLLA